MLRGREAEDQQYGFRDENSSHVVHSIAFACLPEIFRARMERDPVYKNWCYENVEEEDNREMDPMTFAQLEEARKREDIRLAEDRKREE